MVVIERSGRTFHLLETKCSAMNGDDSHINGNIFNTSHTLVLISTRIDKISWMTTLDIFFYIIYISLLYIYFFNLKLNLLF